jgi:hypothetical protein
MRMWLAVTSALSLALGAVHGQSDDKDAANKKVLADIISQWNSRQAKFARVVCEVEGEETCCRGRFSGDIHLPPGATGDVPAQDATYPIKIKWLLDLERNRALKEWRGSIFNAVTLAFGPRYVVHAYNGGDEIRMFEPRNANLVQGFEFSERQPDLHIQTKEFGKFFGDFDNPIFFALGIVPTPLTTPSPDKLRGQRAVQDFEIQGRGIHEGRECVVLRARPKTSKHWAECWVNLAQGASVVRWVHCFGDYPYITLDVDYRQDAHGWVPTEWTCQMYRLDNSHKLELSQRVRVTTFTPNATFDAAEFNIAWEPGLTVYDQRNDKTYRVAANGSLQELDPVFVMKPAGGTPWYLAGVLVIVGAALALLAWFVRKRWIRSLEGV